MQRSFVPLLISTLALGCPADDPGTDGGGTNDGTDAATDTSDEPTSTTPQPTSTDPTPTDDSGTSDGADDDGPGEPVIPDSTTPCGNNTYECGDTIDNDGDGFYDLWDPECTGPCDDDEASFQTGIPGDNVDCKQDCFFDGNSGSGDDGCNWDLICDENNPGGAIGCEYSGGNNCANANGEPTQACIDFCTQYVPPGCDCFGCCEVDGPDGPVHIFLNSGPECSIANLDACQSCTPNEMCKNDCVPGGCELCFGETELPEGCGNVTCDNEMPCVQNADCQQDWVCQLGCCYPPAG